MYCFCVCAVIEEADDEVRMFDYAVDPELGEAEPGLPILGALLLAEDESMAHKLFPAIRANSLKRLSKFYKNITTVQQLADAVVGIVDLVNRSKSKRVAQVHEVGAYRALLTLYKVPSSVDSIGILRRELQSMCEATMYSVLHIV